MKLALTLALLLSAAPAAAAPVFTRADLHVQVLIPGNPAFSFSSSGTVSVTGSSVFVPAGLVSLGSSIVVPVTGTTAIQSLSIMTLSNLSGTFSIGGVTAQAPGEVCPGGAAAGEACNAGGGIGGTMALTGGIQLNIIPTPFPIIVQFGAALGVGQGGSTNVPFTRDAAAWSTGTGFLGRAGGLSSEAGDGSPLRLVSPTYVDALGTEFHLWTTLTLTAISLPVPEAGAALLVGCAGLALMLWRRS